jgi:hypothetical protein
MGLRSLVLGFSDHSDLIRDAGFIAISQLWLCAWDARQLVKQLDQQI